MRTEESSKKHRAYRIERKESKYYISTDLLQQNQNRKQRKFLRDPKMSFPSTTITFINLKIINKCINAC